MSETAKILRVADDGRCSQEEAVLALGVWSSWHHHPSLREDMFDGTMDMDRMAQVLRLAGLEPPWLQSDEAPVP